MEGLKEFWHEFCEKPLAQRAFYYLLFLTIAETFFYYIRPINNALGVSEHTDMILSVFWIIGIYFAIPMFTKTVRIVDVLLYLTVSTFYFISPYIYPITSVFVHDTFSIFAFHTIPFYFIGLLVNFQRDKKELLFISRAQLILTFIFTLLALSGRINSSVSGEQMAKSYSVLFPTMFEFYYYSKHRQKKDFIFFALGMSLILMFGTRGPLLCMIVFVFAFLLQNYRRNTVLTINILLVLGTIYVFLRPIMLVLMFLTRTVGLSTRIFESYLDEELFNYEKSSGRDRVQDLLWTRITEDTGGIGYGFGSDRILGENGTRYAHNLVYEIWMDFGIYIGSILLLLLLFFIVKIAMKIFGTDRFNFFLMLFVFSIVHLMLSGSYIQDFQIYFFLGYCVNILRSSDEESEPEEEMVLVMVTEEDSKQNE